MFETLINVTLPPISVESKKALVLTGCNVKLLDEEVYSEFEELNYYSFNCNDYGCGQIWIHLLFENNFNNPYFTFFLQSISIRTNNGIKIKVNKNAMPDRFMLPNYSKVTKEGKVAVGLGWYPTSEEEVELLKKSKLLSVEGFVAIDKPKNIYSFVCKLVKDNDEWHLVEGNTYRIYKNRHIRSLSH